MIIENPERRRTSQRREKGAVNFSSGLKALVLFCFFIALVDATTVGARKLDKETLALVWGMHERWLFPRVFPYSPNPTV